MSDQKPAISNAFQLFLSEAPQHAQAWMTAVQGLDKASALDKKTEELAYLAVLAALRELTGRDTEPTAPAWRRLLNLPQPRAPRLQMVSR